MRRDHTENAVHARADPDFLALGSLRWWSGPSLLPPDLAPQWVSLLPFLTLFLSPSHQHLWVLSHSNPVSSSVEKRKKQDRWEIQVHKTRRADSALSGQGLASGSCTVSLVAYTLANSSGWGLVSWPECPGGTETTELYNVNGWGRGDRWKEVGIN